jgi:EF hand
MKIAQSIVAAAAFALGASAAYADTRNSDKNKSTMEEKASPSTKGKQDEERTHSHSQPDVPAGGGTTARTTKGDPRSSTENLQKQDAAKRNGTAKQDPFSALDTDGDGAISKAEAAGNAELMNNFDRADKNRDGKLSRQEYAAIGKPTPAEKKRAKSETSAR